MVGGQARVRLLSALTIGALLALAFAPGASRRQEGRRWRRRDHARELPRDRDDGLQRHLRLGRVAVQCRDRVVHDLLRERELDHGAGHADDRRLRQGRLPRLDALVSHVRAGQRGPGLGLHPFVDRLDTAGYDDPREADRERDRGRAPARRTLVVGRRRRSEPPLHGLRQRSPFIQNTKDKSGTVIPLAYDTAYSFTVRARDQAPTCRRSATP